MSRPARREATAARLRERPPRHGFRVVTAMTEAALFGACPGLVVRLVAAGGVR